MVIRQALIFFLCIASQLSWGEYRVYQYLVTNKVFEQQEENTPFFKVSNLDPTSFIAYNGGASLISARLYRSWICPGNTNHFKEYCPSPYEKIQQKVPLP